MGFKQINSIFQKFGASIRMLNNAEAPITIYTKEQVDDLVNSAVAGVDISGKVDKVSGKSLILDTEIARLATISGTNTGDETASTIISKIGNGGIINQSYLPSFVDDVLEFANLTDFPTTGETGKIYVAISPSNVQYRWSGASYIAITNGLIASTNDVSEGANNFYFTNARTILATLTSYAKSLTNRAIVATDNIITAISILEKKGDDNAVNIATNTGAISTLQTGKLNTANVSQNVISDASSTSFVPSVKSVVDYFNTWGVPVKRQTNPNLFSPTMLGLIANTAIDGVTGAQVTSTNAITTPNIPVLPLTQYEILGLPAKNYGVAYKTSAGVVISAQGLSGAIVTINTPANCAFVQFTCKRGDDATIPSGLEFDLFGVTNELVYEAPNGAKLIADNVKVITPELEKPYPINTLNVIKDASLNQQIINSNALIAPWVSRFGGASSFLANITVSSINHLKFTTALSISCTKRSSDNFNSDYQVGQLVVIPENQRAQTTWGAGFWMKRDIAQVNISFLVSYYANDNGTGATTSVTPALIITNETVGNWVWVRINPTALPANVKSLIFHIRVSGVFLTTLNVIYNAQITGVSLSFIKSNITEFIENTDEKIKDIAGTTTNLPENLKNKIWCSFGDSITAANGFQPTVSLKTGLNSVVRGIGGTTVSENGAIAWVDASGLYLNRPPASQPVGSFEILSSMSNQQRINTIPTNTQIISVMAGTNDFGLPIGLITDATVATFYGAYQLMLDKIYARIPNAEIVLVTPIHRNTENTVPSNGNFFEQYRVAIRAVAAKYKYRLIDMAESGINQNNQAVMLSDGIHPNSTGYERMARLFINEFNKIY